MSSSANYSVQQPKYPSNFSSLPSPQREIATIADSLYACILSFIEDVFGVCKTVPDLIREMRDNLNSSTDIHSVYKRCKGSLESIGEDETLTGEDMGPSTGGEGEWTHPELGISQSSRSFGARSTRSERRRRQGECRSVEL
ncbi:hypothetical protein TrVE_jg10354 [Triparma verrucosa]|uniref:Uncharacterized protein n=1 Tax=Triparma verrucosa TaxID=1606542 RepID=A0A9W7EZ61_9STRA|nr:hypothetical protein TrVE_jg10354 [Triparma verrucosa]